MTARYRTLLTALLFVGAAACGNEGDPLQEGNDNVSLAVPMPEDAAVSTPDAELPDAAVADAAPVPVPSNLPCDVEEVLSKNCQRCHGETAKNGTSLMTRASLIAASVKDPALHVIDRALLRMAEIEKPMPPIGKGEAVSEESRAVLENWVDQGMPAATCVK